MSAFGLIFCVLLIGAFALGWFAFFLDQVWLTCLSAILVVALAVVCLLFILSSFDLSS